MIQIYNTANGITCVNTTDINAKKYIMKDAFIKISPESKHLFHVHSCGDPHGNASQNVTCTDPYTNKDATKNATINLKFELCLIIYKIHW